MPTLTPSSEDVRIYEVTVLYPYPMNQKEESDLLKEIDAIFAEAGAKLVESDKWGRRGLAYTIKGHDEGNFIVYYYEMDPSKLQEIDEALHILQGALRHIIVKPPKGYELVKFSESYDTWLKERETESEKKERAREEKIKKQVAERAKRQVKRAGEKKAETQKEDAGTVDEGQISDQLDKIISDDELDL